MALSRKYKALLLRSKVHSIALRKCVNLCKNASDLELVLIHDKTTNELKKRGILDE